MNQKFIAEIDISIKALEKIYELINSEENINQESNIKILDEKGKLSFRAQIIGGGCHGLKYNFLLDQIQENDFHKLFTGENPVNLIVDKISYLYLKGAHIDYEKSIYGESFIVSNPLAATKCSCGQSFNISE